MKHTYLLFLLGCCILFPVDIAYGQVPQTVRMVTKLSSRLAANLTGKEVEQAAHFALSAIRKPIDPAVIQNPSASKKYLQTTSKWQREAVQGSLVSRIMIPELKRTQTPLANLGQSFLKWDDLIVNKTLKKAVDEAIARNDYKGLQELLDNYYSLDDGKAAQLWDLPTVKFVDSATHYFLLYGRMNLKLRDVLKSPFVDEVLKKKIQVFVAKKELLLQEEPFFRGLITAAYEQYRLGLFEMLTSKEVSALVNAYEGTYRAALAFVANTGRMPHRTAGPQEQELAERIDFLMKYADTNQFISTQESIQSLKSLQERYPMEVLEWDAFVTQYKEHVGNDISRLLVKPWREEGYTEQERLLYNSLQYHCQNGREQDFWNLEGQIINESHGVTHAQ